MALADFINVKPTLTSQRLLLRPLQPTDVEDLRQWTADPALYRYWGKKAGRTDKDPALLFTRVQRPGKSFHWGIVLRQEQKVVGELWVYLIENDRMAKVAFRLSPAYQGQGCATEALGAAVRFCFSETELQRLWSDVDQRNQASCRVLEKCGFTREGLIRQGKMVSSWCDYYLYGLLKTDLQA